MTMKSVHFVCTHVLYALQASCTKCFSKQLPTFYYWTCTKRLPFYDISDVVQKKIFLHIIEQFDTRPRRRNTITVVLVTRLLPNAHCGDSYVSVRLQLSRERLSEKVHATIPKGIVGGFEFTVFQRSLKEWHERPWTYVCEC